VRKNHHELAFVLFLDMVTIVKLLFPSSCSDYHNELTEISLMGRSENIRSGEKKY